MLTTVEAEIGTNGVITLLEPVNVTRVTRAIVTILDDVDNDDDSRLDPGERKHAINDLMKHAGAVSDGDEASGDNARIDADLAHEFGKEL